MPSVNEWIKKLWYIYTMNFYTAERKKKTPTLHDSMDGTRELSEISQVVKDKSHMISPISGT